MKMLIIKWLNSFYINNLFLYHQKTSEDVWLVMFSVGIKRDQRHDMG